MKILHLNDSDLDGGAAKAAYRLHQGLQTAGHQSNLLVRTKASANSAVLKQQDAVTKLGPLVSYLPLRLSKHKPTAQFSPQHSLPGLPNQILRRARLIAPDIVHLHWICNGYLTIESLRHFQQPITWTLHDMWPLTGGCHYSQQCTRYQQTCGNCPILTSTHSTDLSHNVWQRKAKAWRSLNLTLIAPSQWIARCAKHSSVLRHHRITVIPHGLDTTIYKPLNQAFARQALNLPPHKTLILFGASSGVTHDPRKGFLHLQAALQSIKSTGQYPQAEAVVFGTSKPSQPFDMGLPTHYLGKLHDDSTLALIYSAADVMVVPSQQETFGQTASEALACGIPVAAFDVTGLKDVVSHQQDGYLAQPFDSKELANGIMWILEDPERYRQMCAIARQKAAKEFSLSLQAKRHGELYKELLELKQSMSTC